MIAYGMYLTNIQYDLKVNVKITYTHYSLHHSFLCFTTNQFAQKLNFLANLIILLN